MSIIPASRLSSSDLARLGNNLRPSEPARKPLFWRRYSAQRLRASASKPAQAK